MQAHTQLFNTSYNDVNWTLTLTCITVNILYIVYCLQTLHCLRFTYFTDWAQSWHVCLLFTDFTLFTVSSLYTVLETLHCLLFSNFILFTNFTLFTVYRLSIFTLLTKDISFFTVYRNWTRPCGPWWWWAVPHYRGRTARPSTTQSPPSHRPLASSQGAGRNGRSSTFYTGSVLLEKKIRGWRG